MPTYVYCCNNCKLELCKKHNVDEDSIPDDLYDQLLYETRYGFSATEDEISKAIECPDCGGSDVHQVFTSGAHIRIKGSNWEEFYKDGENKKAIKRDLDLHKLEHNDPYAEHRPDGDKEAVRDNIINSRKKQNKRIYFT